MKTLIVHAKVDGALRQFVIVNPTNLVINETLVADGETVDVTGAAFKVTKVVIHVPQGGKLVIEETLEQVKSLLEE